MPSLQNSDEELTIREKANALYEVAKFRPKFAAAVVGLSILAALLEGFGLSFILPIIDLAQSGGTSPSDASSVLQVFLRVYEILGVPFTMGYLVTGVIGIMTVRFTTSFLVGWFRAAIETQYVRYLQTEAFDHALDARISYFDNQGSDDILNAIVTQAEYAGQVIRFAIQTIEQAMLSLVYVAIALYFAPQLTLAVGGLLVVAFYFFSHVIESGYSLGDQVAIAKEGIQEHSQAGTQGIRDVKLFGMSEELRNKFRDSVEAFEHHRIRLRRNQEAINNFYQLATAVGVFVLLYAALTFSSLSFGALGIFLFAMFRLGPKLSALKDNLYRTQGELPHLVRTQVFVDTLKENRERDQTVESVPESVDTVSFDDVSFTYERGGELVLKEVSFEFESGEFVAFVGPSGAGKSTIVALLARLYQPDSGEIRANGTSIDNFDVQDWRSKISVVRQNPHIFNDTLRKNLTIGNRSATQDEIEAVCKVAQVTEFLEELPNGYDTKLGDQGVKLSGGQRQRLAIARALLKDAELLILDEATSDLDSSLEAQVQEGIENLDRDYAMLTIAHRLSTVRNADQIYAMENGRIVEDGTHDELLKEDGVYSSLHSMQFTS